MNELETIAGARAYREAEALMERAGLHPQGRPERMYGVRAPEGALMGCAGADGNVIKYVAVSQAARGEGVTNALISHLVTELRQAGYGNVFLFTKPENQALFASLGFHAAAAAGEALLMEWKEGGAAALYGAYREPAPGETGAVVMNADPFTNGHLSLIRRAASACGLVHVLVVESQRSCLPFSHRLALVRAGTEAFPNVRVHPGGPYVISEATFPSYFLKEPSRAAAVHAALDAEAFGALVAPALGAVRRFVGEEPLDAMTAGYNQALAEALPRHGVRLTVLPRLHREGEPVSASQVRSLWRQGEPEKLRPLVPETTYAYIKEHPCR